MTDIGLSNSRKCKTIKMGRMIIVKVVTKDVGVWIVLIGKFLLLIVSTTQNDPKDLGKIQPNWKFYLKKQQFKFTTFF